MRYGIFGGSFDPPHLAHLALARAARDTLNLDEVILVPAFQSPFKRPKPEASGKHRLAMLTLMASGEPWLSVSNIEIARRGTSYTIETLEALQHARPGQYWLIMGSDTAAAIASWNSADRLMRLARLAVATRPGAHPPVPVAWDDAVDEIPMPSMSVSSSEIRDRLERGLSVSSLLHPEVAAYIQEQGLYGGRS